LPAIAVADFDPIANRDLALQPALDELARRGDEARQQRIVDRGKRVLPGLQPRRDVAERAKVAKGHCLIPTN